MSIRRDDDAPLDTASRAGGGPVSKREFGQAHLQIFDSIVAPTWLQARPPSERRVRALLANAADGIAVLDSTGTVIFVTPSLCAMLGRSETDVVGQPGWMFMEPADHDRLRAIVIAAHGRALGPIDLRLRRADGTLVEFEGTRSDLCDDPDVGGIVWNLRDVSATRHAQQLVERSEERLRALAEASSDITAIVDSTGMLTYVSPAVEHVLGHRVVDAIGRDLGQLGAVHRDDAVVVRRQIESLLKGDVAVGLARIRIRRGDGEWRWFSAQFRDLADNPAIGGTVVNLRDVTEQHMANAALQRSELRYRSIVETAGEGIWIHDLDGRPTFANPKMAAMLHTSVDDLQRRSVLDFVRPDDVPAVRAHIASRRSGASAQYELTLVGTTGDEIQVLVSASALRDADGTVTGTLKMISDITERKLVEAENARLALEDSLTGVANRALLKDRLEQTVSRAGREGTVAAVLYLDLDDFKRVNDSLGHAVGDALLCHVARSVKGAVQPHDTVARVGGDEFVVVLDSVAAANDAVAVAEAILHALRQPIDADGTAVIGAVSIGIALTPAESVEQLLRDADAAMYRAKQRGGARYELFDATLYAPAVARLELERDMRVGLSRQQFEVHYQPVVSLDGTIVGVEALARWKHPTRGFVPPSEFIPVAEETGFIIELGAFILDQACRDVSRWRQLPATSRLALAVNLSVRQVVAPHLAGDVAAILRRHALDPRALCLEITESVLMDDLSAVTRTLTEVHELGVRLAIDDFGTGYSSLLYLRRFPVSVLKLDRFFIAGVDTNPQDPAIVRALIDLAHSLDLVAVAEGVESAEQLRALTAMGCDLAQGFYWSGAVAADDMEKLLVRGRIGPSTAPLDGWQLDVGEFRYSGDDALPPVTEGRATVLVVDGSPGERRLLHTYLEESGSFHVVGEASDWSTAITMARRTKPDVVMLDMTMGGTDAFESLPRLIGASPTSQVVVLSRFVTRDLRAAAIAAGATAVLDKARSLRSIADDLRRVVVARAAGVAGGKLVG